MSLTEIPGVGRFKPQKPGCIHLKCGRCGMTRSNMPRHRFDLDGAAVIVTNFCPRCDKGGGFEDSNYYDLGGKEILP